MKVLYAELNLEAVFSAYETESYQQLVAMIQTTAEENAVPPDVYLALLHKIYKRSK